MITVKDITDRLQMNLDTMCNTCPFATEGSATMTQVKNWNKSKGQIVETVKDGITGIQFETARSNYDAGLDKGMALQARKDEHTLP